ncbi:MAG: VWA domain-containing protein [Bacteroidota bacterium]
MKKIISYLAFLPFFLAILWAAKVYGEKLFSSLEAHRLYSTELIDAHNHENSTAAQIQVALLLDISGSMNGLIEQAKSKLWQVVNELSDAQKGERNPNLEIALYVYGGSTLDSQKGYVQQLAPLTTDLDLISEKLFSLTTNGGEEYCGQAIQLAHLELDWSKSQEDLKMIFIAGNEPFNQGSMPYQNVCQQAKAQDILVNTIFCGPHLEGINSFWKHGADLAGGAYMNIDHNVQSVHIATPYDDEISQLNVDLNDTYHAFSGQGRIMKERQVTQDMNAQKFGSANTAKRAISKSKGAYKNSSWDLVDAYREKKVKLKEIKTEELGEEFKGLDEKGLELKIEELSNKRSGIQKKIVELDKKRKAYVAEQRKDKSQDQTLDAAMSKTIRKQAESKNYKFKE